jgi:hypothetical protein
MEELVIRLDHLDTQKNINFMKNLFYFIIAFVAFLISLFSVILYQSRNEYKSKYNFVITKIAINSKGYLTFYNNEKDYLFSNYLFREEDSISKGDRIFKDSCSKILYVYRKSESSEVYEVFLKKEPNGTYPIEWFCN